jgi:DNA-binding GntR family transcriptional regulator
VVWRPPDSQPGSATAARNTWGPPPAEPIADLRTLSEQTYVWIKERIFTGDLEPGERISIEALAQRIGVSRTPVRDAVNRLAQEGLVHIAARRGTFIAPLTPDDVAELYDTRYFLEPSISEEVARGASRKLIAELTEIQQHSESIEPTSVYRDFAAHERYIELDARFHLRIVAECANARLENLVAQCLVQRRVAPRLFRSDFDGPPRRIAEHRAVLDAIAQHQPDEARLAMRRHLRCARDELLAYLRRGEPASSNGLHPG